MLICCNLNDTHAHAKDTLFPLYQAATGTLKFDTYLNIALAVGLIVMPLYVRTQI